MFVVIVIAMALVVGGAAVVALGGGGTLPEAEHDRLAVRLPQDRALSRTDVDELRLPMALRGYRMDEVDDVLDRLGAELALRDARIAELEAVGVVSGSVPAGAGAGAVASAGEPLPGLESFTAVLEKEPQAPVVGEATEVLSDEDAERRDAGRKGDRA
ncbi:DivIVA domain-containing protein [Kitasatospora phosalacinea]|uniref:DivIVA domain-containing protein n=1 Tax=Kitasatospora phosalacinea TaxID=2065 RepID=UPI00068E9971|nr:DivIVA domain-containing protein [Kitasatospora phosalacinea]